jgi:putative spermidine/putrescine transport system substrate-binding protein
MTVNKPLSISRRTVLRAGVAVAAAPTVFVRDGWAQSKTMTISIWSGYQGEYIKKEVVGPFERQYACTVRVNEGVTLEHIAKVRAEKANPQNTVVFVDDLGIDILKQENLINPLPKDKIPNLSNALPRFIYDDGYGVAIGISMVGTAYNTTLMKPPARLKDLWDPKYRSKLTMYGPRATPAVYLMISAAAIATGKPYSEAQYLVDQGWPLLRDLKPNIQNIAASPAQALSQVLQGEVNAIVLDYSKWVYPYTIKKAPVDVGYTSDGTWAGVNCMALVKNAPNQDLGMAFMDKMLDKTVQFELSKFALTAPPISGLEFPEETLRYIAYPEKKMVDLGLFSPDWKYVNKARSAWTETWNTIYGS